MNCPRLSVSHLREDLEVSSLLSLPLNGPDAVQIDRYWSGQTAPASRACSARLWWSASALYVRFDAAIGGEEMIVNDEPVLTEKTLGLWNRDVCEVFIAPEPADSNRYFEFEVAPTGEWVDLAIEWTAEKRDADTDYRSGLEAAARIDKDIAVMCLKIGWEAFGQTPQAGDHWRGNLYRCVGKGAERGYLAWSPTETDTPNFHVPSRFGKFEFMP